MSSPSSAELRLRSSEALFTHRAGAQIWDWQPRSSYARLHLLSALRLGGPRRLLDLGGELGATARNVMVSWTGWSATA
jgi:hypothetical protein